jgi:hypothetical protein
MRKLAGAIKPVKITAPSPETAALARWPVKCKTTLINSGALQLYPRAAANNR